MIHTFKVFTNITNLEIRARFSKKVSFPLIDIKTSVLNTQPPKSSLDKHLSNRYIQKPPPHKAFSEITRMSSDNRIGNEKPSTVPRLSLKITRNPNINSNTINLRNSGVSFTEGDLMSPKTRSVALTSSSSKEVPRAALNNSPPSTSDFTELMTIDAMDTAINAVESQQNHRNLIEDSIQGLEALAASAVAASLPKASRPIEEESEILGNIFNSSFDEQVLLDLYKKHCSETAATDKLREIIDKSDELLKSKSITMSLQNIFPLFIERIIQQEVKRTGGKSDLTNLLTDENFLSSSATVILMLPRLISILFTIEDVSTALNSNLFDVLLSIEQVLRALPELQKLPATQKSMQNLQNILLEDSVWKANEGENTLYKLMKLEFNETVEDITSASSAISSTLTGIRSCQKALETLSGFQISGVRLTRLELFFRKYLRLAAQRIQYATLRLGLSPSITQFSWELFFELVQQEGNNELFQNRHLNQILLSVIYCTSHLLEDDRTFQQISQVLPSAQSQNTWLNGFNDEKSGDFYTFYNEKFIPPLRKKIETFLKKRENSDGSDGTKWILNELFTSAPFPINYLHHMTPNITLNRLNQPKPQPSKILSQKYEWINPAGSSHLIDPLPPQTPNSTSQLFNLSTSPVTPQKRHSPESSDTDDFKLKKVARRLDFSDEFV